MHARPLAAPAPAADGATIERLRRWGIGQLFDVIREAVVVADAETGRIVLWNPSAEALLGYTATEAQGMTIDDLVPERLRAAHRAGRLRFARTGHRRVMDAPHALLLPALAKGGAEAMVELTLTPIQSSSELGAFVLAVLRGSAVDRSLAVERAHLEAAVATSRAIEHALADPITALHGRAELLLDDPRLPGSLRADVAALCVEARSAAARLSRFAGIRRYAVRPLPGGDELDLDGATGADARGA